MLRKLSLAVLLALLLASVALAGGGGQEQSFFFSVQGIPGWEIWTGSSVKATITPPFYNEGEGNVAYAVPPHADQFTVVYWTTSVGRLSTEAHSTPNLVGDMLYEGKVEVGANDTRTTQTFDWYVDNYQSTYTWFATLYNVDTRHCEFMKLIEPGSTETYGSFTARTSVGGYDLMVAGFQAPEPTSLVTMLTGMVGLIGWGTRRRRP